MNIPVMHVKEFIRSYSNCSYRGFYIAEKIKELRKFMNSCKKSDNEELLLDTLEYCEKIRNLNIGGFTNAKFDKLISEYI